MKAAGPAAQITSRIGGEPATTVNRVLMNDSQLLQANTAAGVGSSTDAVRDENYYNASSALVFLFLVGLLVGLIYFVRRRLRRSGQGDFANHHTDTQMSLKNFPPDPLKDRPVNFEPVPTDDLDDPRHPNLPSNNTAYQDLPR